MATRGIAEPHQASVVVFKQLSEEFGDRIDSGTIHRVASEVVALFDGAKVRDFIPMIAWRLARTRLKDLLEGQVSIAPTQVSLGPNLGELTG